MTSGIQNVGEATVTIILQKVAQFDAFTKDNPL